MLSLGDSFFHLYGRLGDWIPPLAVFRYPQRIVALFAIAWAALLALGAAGIGELPRSRRLALGAASFALGFRRSRGHRCARSIAELRRGLALRRPARHRVR